MAVTGSPMAARNRHQLPRLTRETLRKATHQLPARWETDIGLFFRHDALHGHLLAESFVEWRHDAPHALAGPVVEAGLRLRAVF